MKLIIFIIAILSFNIVNADIRKTAYEWFKLKEWWYQEVKFWKYNQAITIFDKQIKTLQDLWYSDTRIIDLLAIRTMECNSYKWDCKWMYSSDIWSFQLNPIHKVEYKKSQELFNKKKWWELFIYQAKKANIMLDSYEKRFCSEKIFNEIWRTYNQDERFKCYARAYNWSSKKKSYAELALLKRQVVEKYYLDNYK